MEHSAYNLIKRWSAIGRKIIKTGIADGSFRRDLSLSVVRDAIFGLVDIENIQSMAANETPQANTDLEAILDLVLPMIRADAPEASLKDDKEGRILNAAQNLFGDKGFQSATVQEIAKASEVSEGTIYEYFKNKEDLLFSVLKRQFRNNLESMDELFEIRTPLRKLRRFVRYHFTIYLMQPVFVKMFLFDAIYNARFYSSDAYPLFKHYIEGVSDILDEGKKDGSIRPEIDNRIFRNLFMGTFSHMAIRWMFTEKGSQEDKLKDIDDAVSMLGRAVAAKPSNRRIV